MCGGWSEQRIRCKIEFNDDEEEFTENHRLFVHLQCDNWKGMPTHFRSLGDNVVEFHRVLPPGRQFFFFTKKNMSTSDAKYLITESLPKQSAKVALTREQVLHIDFKNYRYKDPRAYVFFFFT